MLNWASEVSLTLGCSIEISHDICMLVGLWDTMKNYVCKKYVGGITWPKHAHAQSLFRAVRTKLKANRASEIEEQRKERLDKARK